MTRNYRITTVCFGLMLYMFLNASTDAAYEPLLLVRGIRPMGLGNAFEAIADDENAFHYNPAGLAQREQVMFNLLLVRPRISSDLADESPEQIREIYEAIDTLMDCDNALEDQSPECRAAREELTTRLEEALNESLGASSDLPSIGLAVPFRINDKYKLTVGGSFYTQSLVSLRVEPRGLAWADPIKDMLDNPIIYNISTQWAWEIAGALEFSVDKAPILSRVYTGIALRRIHRSVFTDEENPFAMEDIINPDGPDGIEGTDDDFSEVYFDTDQDMETVGDFIDFVRDNAEKRKGYGIDIGAILVPVDGVKLAFVVRSLTSGISVAEEDRSFPRNIVLSAAIKPLSFLRKPLPFLDLTLAASLDGRHGDDRLSDFSIDKYTDKIHLGAEATLFPNRSISLSGRIGNNQGFPTYGASLKLGTLNLDFVRYSDLETDWYAGYANINLAF